MKGKLKNCLHDLVTTKRVTDNAVIMRCRRCGRTCIATIRKDWVD